LENIEFEAPTWSQIYLMLIKLARQIKKSSFKPEVIVGVSRGGWPPARILSDLLDNPNLANVKVEFYVGVAETREEPILTQPVSVDVKGKNVLIVDEVADTGKSLQLIRSHLLEMGAKEVKIATIYHKPWSSVRPDYSVKETSRWIVFPWEIRETIRKLVNKFGSDGEALNKSVEKLVAAGLPRSLVNYFLRDVLEGGN